MARGGKRKGAGRKKGAATKKTRLIADLATADGITPLEIMLQAMRHHYRANDIALAVAIARDVAPYMHPKLSAVAAITNEGDGFGKLLEVLEQRRRRPAG
jgi:hypothetical protein